MFRLLLEAVDLGTFLIYTIPVILELRHMRKTDPERSLALSFDIIQKKIRGLMNDTGSTITVIGKENIPDCPVLYVGNHRSYFDILTMYQLFPHITAFVAKQEMEHWFTLAEWMKLGDCLFLDRDDLKAGLKTILAAVDEVKSGTSLFIFPEGTRCENPDILDLLPFHEGSMKIASRSGCPVVPVAITGTRDIWENHIPWIHPAKVTAQFGEPFYIADLHDEDKKHPGAYTRQRIIDMLKEEQIRRGENDES